MKYSAVIVSQNRVWGVLEVVVVWLRVLGVLGALLGLVALLAARFMGAHWNLLLLLGLLGVPFRLLGLAWDIKQKRVHWPGKWPATHRGALWFHTTAQSFGSLMGAWAISVAIVPVQLEDSAFTVQLMVMGLLVIWASFAWLPSERPRWGLTVLMLGIGGLFGWDLAHTVNTPEAVLPPMRSPLAATAVVLHGGDTPLINHHSPIVAQHHALDVVALRDGLWMDGPASEVSSYGCWGVAVLAPADGEVVTAVGDLPDNEIGSTDIAHLAGNHVTVRVGPTHYIMLAHLQSGSVQVSEGDRVSAGQVLGRCGNSGNTTLPHLHIQLMNNAQFSNADETLHTWPMAFVNVEREGQRMDRVPRRNDILHPGD